MTKILKEIWSSKNGKLVFFFAITTLGGIYLYCVRPSVSTITDLTKINGTLDHIEQVSVYTNRIKKTEGDSTYHFYLNEYTSKFHPSYFPYDGKDLYKSAKYNDSITFHIAKEEIDQLYVFDAKIRSFSLAVNDKIYFSADSGLMGFGKGYFELGMIIISLIINLFLIKKILYKNKTASNNI